MLERPALCEALELASPSLSDALARVQAGEHERLRMRGLRRAALAALRYEIRMATRPTPFGIFAGVAQGSFGARTAIAAGAAHRTRTRVDMEWLLRIVHRLEREPAVLDVVRVRAHQGLVRRAGRVILDAPSTRGRRPGEEGRSEVSVRESPVVAALLAEAATPVALSELCEDAVARFGARHRDAVRGLLARLVDEELLITDLRPPLDGGDPLHHVIAGLHRVAHPPPSVQRTLRELRAVARACTAYDAQPVGDGRPALHELLSAARAAEPAETPVHVELALDLEVTLAERVRADVERAADLLWRLSPRRLGMRPLRGYHGQFIERYGLDRLVPLLELLDDHGSLGAPFGYGWPPSESADAPPADAADDARAAVLAELLDRALAGGSHELVLDDGDIERLRGDDDGGDVDEAQSSCELYIHLAAASADAIDAGAFVLTLSPSPGSHHAGATAGRFATLDPGWAAHLDAARASGPRHVDGAVLADLAFMPRSGRAANLAHTAPGTGRRISVGLPDSDRAEELALADLAVGGTMQRLLLVHLPTGREVVPVLPNMVSPSVQAPNAARLLYELGMEGQRLWEPWSWGALERMPFLPRVRCGRVVLSPATWRLDALRDAAEESAAAWERALAAFRARRRVPRHVLTVSTDKRLLLDLDDAWHRDILRDDVRRNDELVACEVIGEHDEWRVGAVRGHTLELVVALERRRRRPALQPSPAWRDPRRHARAPGEDWLSWRIYCPRRTQDTFLREALPGLLDAAAGHGAERWFFIRYTDADGHHLRVRLGGPRAALDAAVLPAVRGQLAAAAQAGRIGRHLLDGYEPEAERYGGADAIAAAERVFEADSRAAVELLDLARDGACPHSLDDLTVLSVAALAHAFGAPAGATSWLDPDAPGDDPAFAWLSMTGEREGLPGDFRRRAAHWRALVDPVGGSPGLRDDPAGARVLASLAARDAAVDAYGREIRALRAAGRCPTPEARIVGSLLHMTCNRLVGGTPEREQRALAIARGAVQDNASRRRRGR